MGKGVQILRTVQNNMRKAWYNRTDNIKRGAEYETDNYGAYGQCNNVKWL